MPAGTLYSEYEPCFFRGLYIKADNPGNYENDWLYDDLIGAVKCSSTDDFLDKCEQMEQGASVEADFENTGRDGMFDDEQLYGIYEKDDVKKLIERLTL